MSKNVLVQFPLVELDHLCNTLATAAGLASGLAGDQHKPMSKADYATLSHELSYLCGVIGHELEIAKAEQEEDLGLD